MKLTRATDEHIDFFSILRFYIVTEKLLLSAYVENFACTFFTSYKPSKSHYHHCQKVTVSVSHLQTIPCNVQ